MKQNLNRKRGMIVSLTVCLLVLVSISARTAIGQTRKANGRIAYAGGGSGGSGIWTMNADGSDRRQITVSQSDQQDLSPSWSPDGRQIAFVRFARVGYEILVMDADGSNQRMLTQPGLAQSPAASWSPDGTKIAFTGFGGVYVMNADGSNQQNIGAGSNPSWSADGSKLVIVGSDALYVLNADGSNYIPLVSSQHPSTDFDLEPVWSPDGSSICFTRSVNCDGYGDCESTTMWTINPDGTNLRNISNMADQGHAWSPDGTKIVFASQGDGALDLFVINKDGTGVTDITNSGDLAESQPSWQPLVSPVPPVNNPIDDAQFFVHQQYADFLNREPDSDGQTFWTNQIIACSGDPQCTEVQRINDSAAFYLSIEFQQTGYLVYRTYKAAYGNLPNAPVPLGFGDFVADTKQIGQGVEVLQPGWDTTLENNKQAFAADFVQRTRFASAFPDALTPDQFVDTLNLNAGNPLSQTERDQLVSDLNSGAKTRANVLRAVAEHPNLVQAEFNRAFVLMQYFGYLRRDPNAGPDTDFTGYNFWLDKLNTFNGDFAQAEMVKAFIESDEYRQRFLK